MTLKSNVMMMMMMMMCYGIKGYKRVIVHSHFIIVADACECGNEPSGSVKCGEFLEYLQTS